MDVIPTAAGSAVSREDSVHANLAQEDPLVKRPRNTIQQCRSVGHTGRKEVNLPGTCNGHPKSRG